jgi:uncharacterized Zn finger protein (UPF0148 family)
MTHEDRPLEWGIGHVINTYKKCPKCGGSNFEVRNYDLMWHDGEVWCTDCDVYVRGYDAG